MGSGASHIEPVTADEVLTVQFTHIRKGGYDTQEVDAFLDRVAATMESEAPLLPDGSMSADDVRNVEFSHMKRGGYDTREVDTFLDRVVAVLGASHPGPEDPIMIDEPSEPGPAIEVPPVAADEPVPAASTVAESPASPGTSGGPRLHDPEGAAQRLLAAAQLAADTLTADAESYSARIRREADDYAAATKSEADGHAERVTAAAESQAAAIREVAADEARRVAEDARAELVRDMDALEAKRAELEEQTASLEGRLATDRTRILALVEELRATVLATGEQSAGAEHALAAHTDLDEEPDLAHDVAEEVEEAFALPDSDEDLGEVTIVVEEESVEIDLDEPPRAEDLDDVADLEVDVVSDEEDPLDATDEGDATATASRSVFDLGDDEADEADDAGWLDEQEGGTAGGLFDIEADPDWDDGGPPTRAMPAVGGEAEDPGDRFFEDLRQADQADSLGPLDDDTDAALSAFFDADDDSDSRSRWSDRFGPGR